MKNVLIVNSIAFLLFGFVLSQNSQSNSNTPEVYFNYSADSSYTDPYRKTKRQGHNLESVILKNIQNAKRSIDVAVQELRLPLLAHELIKKHKEGVRVRIIIESTYNQSIEEWLEQSKEVKTYSAYGELRMLDYVELIDTNRNGKLSRNELLENDAVYMIRDSGIPMIDDTADGSLGSALMHHKFIVIDDEQIIVTSANFTLSDIHGKILDPKTTGNANAMIVVNNKEMAQVFKEEFNTMYGGELSVPTAPSRFGVNKPYRGVSNIKLSKGQGIQIQFSPTSRKRNLKDSTSGLINRTLSTANKSVHMALFVFSDQYIADHLYKVKEEKNLEVSSMIDPSFAFRYYSEALDLLGLAWLAPNCRYTLGNKPWKNSIKTVGAPRLSASDKLHHKFAVIDDTKVIFGSKNWTDSANFQNNETLLIIEDHDIAMAFQREIDYWQGRTHWGVPLHMIQKEEQHRKECESSGFFF